MPTSIQRRLQIHSSSTTLQELQYQLLKFGLPAKEVNPSQKKFHTQYLACVQYYERNSQEWERKLLKKYSSEVVAKVLALFVSGSLQMAY